MYLNCGIKMIVADHCIAECRWPDGIAIILMRIKAMPDLQGALTAD
jgi:hypothetical protein